jgi:hypothetical protein
MDGEWAGLSPSEKREERFKRWLSPPGLTFTSPQAEQAYRERVTRFIKVFKLEEPDRVPCVLPAGLFAASYAGTNLGKVMYDYDELRRAWVKFLLDFEADTYTPPALVPPGRALEALDYRLYKWPGHGLPPDTFSYQAVEGEWMKPEEYDALIRDPSDYWLRTYLPRVFGAFKAFGQLSALTSVQEIDFTMSLLPFGMPDGQAGLQALMEAGRESLAWAGVVMEVSGQALAAGYPGMMGGIAKAPFDTLGDTLRHHGGHVPASGQAPRGHGPDNPAGHRKRHRLRQRFRRAGDHLCSAQGRRRFHVPQTIRDFLLAPAAPGGDGPDRRRHHAHLLRRGQL